ncbi:MAG: GIY-YIG nuclease family protein [Butyrivibrio sp.]|nr:GIY-YIG nuclease family protein [Butyrivibrio sp.]
MDNKQKKNKNYTYLVECADGSLYCGWTNDLTRRINVHNEGKGAKYTRPRLPVRLVYFEEFETKEEAMSREWSIKQLTRAKKLKLVHSFTGSCI